MVNVTDGLDRQVYTTKLKIVGEELKSQLGVVRPPPMVFFM